MKSTSLAVLLFLGAIWGASFLFIKVGVAEIPPLTFVTGRMLIAALVLIMVIGARRLHLPRSNTTWRDFAAMGILNGMIPYTLITWGEQYIDSGLAAILNATMPLFTVLLAHIWIEDESLSVEKLTGVSIGFVGVVGLIGADLKRGLQANLLGELAVVLAAASYALAAVYGRRQLRGHAPLVSSFGQLATGGLMMLPMALVIDHRAWHVPSVAATGSLLSLALLGTALAYILYYWLLEHVGATQVSLVTYILPVTGILWGWLALGERLSPIVLGGFALIFVGIVMVRGTASSAWRRLSRALAA